MSMYAVKNEDDKLFVVRSNDSAYLYQDQNGNLGRTLYRYYSRKDAQHAIERAGHVNQCHVVPLVEKPQPVVVSAEEAEMLEQAKCDDAPAELIVGFVNSHDNYDDDCKAEDRLMRAYVNGWTVKPKRWNVKVPHTKFGYYWQGLSTGELRVEDVTGPEKESLLHSERYFKFTDAEIDQYGLQECEREEIKGDED